MAEPAEALSLDVWLDIGGPEMECQPRAGNCKLQERCSRGGERRPSNESNQASTA